MGEDARSVSVVLRENENMKREQRVAGQEKKEIFVRYVVGDGGLGGARVVQIKSDFYSFLFLFLSWDVTVPTRLT